MALSVKMKMFVLVLMSLFVIGCSSNKSKETAPKKSDKTVSKEAGASSTGTGAEQTIDESNTKRVDFSQLDRVVYFGFDQSTITEDSRIALDRIAAWLKGNQKQVRLEGHTDERGSREYNMALGERRGISAQDYLIAKGISPGRLEVISYGEEKPAVRASSQQAYAKNRRVEIKLK